MRAGTESEVPLRLLVPGDIIKLAAGDMVPADVRVLSAKDLFLNQSALTGEALPVESKADAAPRRTWQQPSGPAQHLLPGLQRGERLGHGGGDPHRRPAPTSVPWPPASPASAQATSFDLGVNKFTWLMIRFIAVMVPAVFLINGLSKHNWMEAFLFALAVAVGLTPEMLPMIVTVNLSKGALAMARKKVIVKRLNAIQNFGAMDVLCTDKTGTLTQGKIMLEKYLDVEGEPSDRVLEFGYLNSYYQTGLKNLMDEAILAHEELEESTKSQGEVPQDRRDPLRFRAPAHVGGRRG